MKEGFEGVQQDWKLEIPDRQLRYSFESQHYFVIAPHHMQPMENH
jgi:hypothetical protein